MGKLSLRSFGKMWGAHIRIDIENLTRSVEELDHLIVGRVAEFRASVDERAARLPPEEQDEYYEWHADEHWQISEVIPRTLWRSLFVTSYTFLEHEMLRICHIVRRARGYEIEPKHLKDTGIHGARTYLTKVASVPFPDGSPRWTEILRINDLRNVIVHRDGTIVLDPSRADSLANTVRKYIDSKRPGLRYDRNGNITLDAQFCSHAVGTIGDFLQEVLAAIPSK